MSSIIDPEQQCGGMVLQPRSKVVVEEPMVSFAQNLCELIQAMTTGSPLYNSYWNLIMKIKKCRSLEEIRQVYPWKAKSGIRVSLPGSK